MKVLSLFDGMSCGRIALDQLGIPVEKYYASEIDKYAMQVSAANYPDIEQVGDICNLDPKDYKDVDLMLAGSPCQGFSFAGKQLAFDDPRSALFFEFIRLLKAIKPKYFLLENVRMKKEFLEVITDQLSQCYAPADVDNQFLNVLGEVRFEPIFINSSLLSAQSRQRYYWTNIPGIQQPEDRGIVLRDILEDSFDSERDKAHCIDANYYKGASVEQYKKKHRRQLVNKPKKAYDIPREILKDNERQRRVYDPSGKSPTVLARSDSPKITTPKQVGKIKDGGQGNRIYSQDGKSSTLSAQSGGTAGNGNTLVETKPKQVGIAVDIKGHDILKRVYSPDGKSPTINTCQGGNREPKVVTGGAFRGRAYDEDGKRKDRDGSSVAKQTKQMLELRKDNKSNAITTVGKDSVVAHDDLTWRKLTPLECERLQTVPDNYTNHVSNTQRYKMLGNGWTVEVIKHILQNMEYENDSKS
jgi:DNA (cytosine-5)-methyltransferase 3A